MAESSRATYTAQLRQRRLAAMRLREIEGNPLSSDQIAMFEMFEREGWPHEQRRAYILAKSRPLAVACGTVAFLRLLRQPPQLPLRCVAAIAK